MKTIDDKEISLLDFLPSSIARDDNVIASAKAIDPHLRELNAHVDDGTILANIDRMPGAVLDHVAYGYDVRPWRDTWSLSMKRSAIKANIINKRKRGTLAAVKAAVESLGGAVRIVEWHKKDPLGTPGTFTIYVSQNVQEGVVAAEIQDDLRAAINEAKPFSRHYEFILTLALNGGIGVYGQIRNVTMARVSGTGVVPV